MAIIKNPRITVLTGVIINILFILIKLIAFWYSHLNLFFADAIDSAADGFIIFVLLLFLRFDLTATNLTYLNMDIMFFCQWSAILMFRLVIFFEQISDLISPEPRKEPVLIINVSSIVLVGGIILAIIFVDEDDVIKFFISEKDKNLRRQHKRQEGKVKVTHQHNVILPIFAEALDNLVTTFVALIVGILLQLGIIVDYLYLVDDISNMVISVVMFILAWKGLWNLSNKYKGKSFYEPIYVLQEEGENDDVEGNGSIQEIGVTHDASLDRQ